MVNLSVFRGRACLLNDHIHSSKQFRRQDVFKLLFSWFSSAAKDELLYIWCHMLPKRCPPRSIWSNKQLQFVANILRAQIPIRQSFLGISINEIVSRNIIKLSAVDLERNDPLFEEIIRNVELLRRIV